MGPQSFPDQLGWLKVAFFQLENTSEFCTQEIDDFLSLADTHEAILVCNEAVVQLEQYTDSACAKLRECRLHNLRHYQRRRRDSEHQCGELENPAADANPEVFDEIGVDMKMIIKVLEIELCDPVAGLEHLEEVSKTDLFEMWCY